MTLSCFCRRVCSAFISSICLPSGGDLAGVLSELPLDRVPLGRCLLHLQVQVVDLLLLSGDVLRLLRRRSAVVVGREASKSYRS